jgi:Ca-activated chloride channel family protein
MRISPCALLISFVVATAPPVARAEAQDQPPPADKTLSPFFFVEGGDPTIDQLPLKSTSVDVAVTGVIADVTVTQVYENHGQRPIHARYVFPASTRAAVHGMTMTIGNRRISARIKEREQAQREFNVAKREGKSASLLEESRPNVFTMNVANVLPGDTIAVVLKYTELLAPTDGLYEFVYPTVVGPRYSTKRQSEVSPVDEFVKAPYTHEGEPPRTEFRLAGLVSAGMPIQELSSPSHQIVSRARGNGGAEIELVDSERFSGNRDFILRYRLSGETIGSGLLLYRAGDENFFLLMAQPPRAVARDEVPPREYVFVVDVSGSMHGFPIDTGKKLMGDLALMLRPSDTFNVVVFADGSQTFAPASVPASAGNLARARQFIGRKDGGGGTELLAALKTAMAIPRQPGVSRSIVLLTDGYIEAEREVFDYIRGQLNDANFFAFGIGSSVNRHLIEGVARAGLGEPFVVTEPGEAPEAA